jgi:hypothetical protein
MCQVLFEQTHVSPDFSQCSDNEKRSTDAQTTKDKHKGSGYDSKG